ncbi:MAG: hypothetical protein ACTSUV_06875 [Candidatus Ranarchaeia archaeon]
MNLVEWTKQYIKYRDIFFKKLVEIRKIKEGLEVEFKDNTVFYFVFEDLKDSLFATINRKENKVIVCNYKIHNMDFLVEAWNKFIEIDNLMLIFAEPKHGKKLLINPMAHSKIADPEKIKEGLHSMYEAGLEN